MKFATFRQVVKCQNDSGIFLSVSFQGNHSKNPRDAEGCITVGLPRSVPEAVAQTPTHSSKYYVFLCVFGQGGKIQSCLGNSINQGFSATEHFTLQFKFGF